MTILLGMMVLTNIILTYVPGCSKVQHSVGASSVDLLALYAKWGQSRSRGSDDLICLSTNLSKHFTTVEVRATGLQSLRLLTAVFFGIGTVVAEMR